MDKATVQIPGLCSSCIQKFGAHLKFFIQLDNEIWPLLSNDFQEWQNHSPPILNHKWAEKTFYHIVTVVFQKTLDSFFVKVLEEEGYTDVISMLTLHDQDIAAFPLPSVTSTSSSS